MAGPYIFDMNVAIDPITGGRVPNATLQVFAIADTTHAMPLQAKDTSGTATTLVSNAESYIPPFMLDDDDEAWLVSGPYVQKVTSYDGIRSDAAASATAAQDSATSSQASAAAAQVAQQAATAAAVAPTDAAVDAGIVRAGALPKWKPNTVYTQGQQVVSPDNDVVSALTAFTSAAAYDRANWGLSGTFAALDGAGKVPLAQVPDLSGSYAKTDGAQRYIRTDNFHPDGILNWVNDSTFAGYLLHLCAGPNSTNQSYAIGIGTDLGHAGGILVSHKNDGVGVNIQANGGAGLGLQVSNYAGSQPAQYVNAYAGSQGIWVKSAQGQGFGDAQTTVGSTTLTSATANFTAADIGATVTQSTWRDGQTANAIPSGTTITAIISATQATMSKAAGATGSNLIIILSGRVGATTQSLLKLYDTGSQILADFQRGSANINVPTYLTTSGQSAPALTVAESGTPGTAQKLFLVTSAALSGGEAFSILADTGAVTVNNDFFAGKSVTIGTSAQSSARLSMNSSGGDRAIYFDTATKHRWQVRALGNAESGGNVGSDFYMSAFADDGTTETQLIMITRGSKNFGWRSSSYGGGSGNLAIGNTITAPNANPTGGGVLYAENGALKWRGSSGTVTTIAAA